MVGRGDFPEQAPGFDCEPGHRGLRALITLQKHDSKRPASEYCSSRTSPPFSCYCAHSTLWAHEVSGGGSSKMGNRLRAHISAALRDRVGQSARLRELQELERVLSNVRPTSKGSWPPGRLELPLLVSWPHPEPLTRSFMEGTASFRTPISASRVGGC